MTRRDYLRVDGVIDDRAGLHMRGGVMCGGGVTQEKAGLSMRGWGYM